MATRARRKRSTSEAPGNAAFKNHVFRDFGGINTQAKRQALKENEFAWIENVMPVGHGNAIIVPGPSATLQSVASGECYYMKDYNLNGVNYMFMATDDGHAYQVALDSPYTRTEIGSVFASAGLRIAQWKNERILIGDPATGLYDWDGASLTHDTATDAPSQISAIETFSGRAWATFGRTLFFSAPDSYTDWQTASSGGSVIITDQTLHSDITQLISANNFLYFTGVDSINVIGDVQVNSLGDTVFSNTNLSASVGTNYALTLIPYFRSVWLANKSGIYSVFGSTPAKASDALDGIFRGVEFGVSPSAAPVMLENILCTAFLLQYNDPRSSLRPIVVLFFNKKWFVASQGPEVTLIAGGEVDGLQNLYATDGTNLFQMFSDTDEMVSWELIGPYWDFGDMTTTKEALAFGFEVDVPEVDGTVTLTIDTLSNEPPFTDSQSYDVALNGFVNWINDAEEIVTWENNALDVVEWSGSGYVMNLQDGSEFGKYIGLSMSSDDVVGTVNSMALKYVWRQQW